MHEFNIQLEAVNLLQLVYATVCLFGIAILLRNEVFRGLLIVLISTVLLMVSNLLEETHQIGFLVSPSFTLAHGPLFYLFVKQLVYSQHIAIKTYLFHLTPAILSLYFTQWTQTVLFIGTVSLVAYLYLCIQLIRKYHQANYNTQSDAYSSSLNWLSHVIYLLATLIIIDLVRLNLQPYLTLPIAKNWYFLTQLGYFILVTKLIIQANNQPTLFTGLTEFEVSNSHIANQDNKTNDIALEKALFEEINSLIQEEQLFLQPRLSLSDLSKKTGLNTKQISTAINQVQSSNFCDYINTLRVNYFLAITKEEPSLSVLDAAFKSGFNSKSSFNTVFKKLKGQTPTQYLKPQKL